MGGIGGSGVVPRVPGSGPCVPLGPSWTRVVLSTAVGTVEKEKFTSRLLERCTHYVSDSRVGFLNHKFILNVGSSRLCTLVDVTVKVQYTVNL